MMDASAEVGPLLLRTSLVCLLAVLGSAQGMDVTSLPGCTDDASFNPGYSSFIINDQTLWTHCALPNPKTSQQRCGLPYDRDAKNSLCNPDSIFNTSEVVALESSLRSLEGSTPYRCTPWHGEILNTTLILVAVSHILVPDLSQNNGCINNCNEIRPVLDETSRESTTDERHLAVTHFTDGLLDNYASYFCDNLIVVVYWQNASVVHTAVSEGLTDTITTTLIDDVQQVALTHMNNGDVISGLTYIIEQYQAKVIGFSPAYILVLVNFGLLVLVAIFFAVFFTTKRKSDYYDEEQWRLVVKAIFKVILGIWFFEMLLIALIRIQEKIKPWCVIFPIIGFLIAVAATVYVYFLELDELTVNSTTSST